MKLDYNVVCRKAEVEFIPTHKLCNDTSGLKLFKIQIPSYYDLVNDFLQFLSPQEINRAERYFSFKDKNRFIICRTLLKFIIAQYTGLDVATINIEKDENKKPYLASKKSINFNVSHSENFAIIAISNGAIGVDVEYLNRDFDFSEILTSTFSAAEIETILKSENPNHVFYTFWTRKEAFVKATGQGITDDFSQIPSMDGSHLSASGLLGDIQNLKILSFKLDENYIAAIAYEGAYTTTDELLVYNPPTSLEELLLFSR